MAKRRPTFFNTELHSELRKVFFKTLTLRTASGMASFLAVASWVFLAVVLWTSLTDVPPLLQTLIVSRAAIAVVAVLFLALIVYPILRVPRIGRLAREVESRKNFNDIVAAGYEFSERENLSSGYSPELVREVIRQAVRSVAGVQVRHLFLGSRQALLVPLAYAALAVLIVLGFTSPAVLLDAAERIVSPRAVSALPHEANLFASPGDVTVLSGSDIEVSALDFGGSSEPVNISFNLAEGFWKTEPTSPGEQMMDDGARMNKYEYTFADIRSSVTYYFRSGDRKSPEYRITVVHKPIVADLEITLTPPEYTGESEEKITDSGGNIQALEGTAVHAKAQANNILEAAWVRFGDGESQRVDVNGRSFEFDFTAVEDGTYSLLLEDELGHKTDAPLVYSIEVYQDNPPVLDVLEPGEDAQLPRSLRVDVSFIAADDYGVSRADIFYRKAGEAKFRRSNVALGEDAGRKDVASEFVWDLSELSLFPGNYVEYYLQVNDNNVVTGPGVTKSRVFTIAVPTMAELYEKIDEEDSKRADLLKEAKKETSELKDRVEKIAREFKKTKELDWTKKKEVDKATAAQENIQEKLEEIQQSLEQTLDNLSDNQMTSQDIGEKMEEINKLLEEINSEALNKYMEELRQAMEKLDPKQIEEALEKLELTAEDLLRGLERTEALLKEIQREQEMEELVRKTKELMDKQDDLNERTSDTDADNEESMDELSDKQEGLSDDTDELQKDLEKMAEKMSEADDQELSKQMEKTAEEFSEQDPSQSMKEASKQLSQGEKQEAQENQEEAMDKLIALFNRMIQMQGAMQNGAARRASENLQRLAKSTLELSFKQERLTDRLRGHSAEDATGIRAMAAEQQSYTKAVEQIANELEEIAKRTLVVPQALMQVLGETITNMRTAMLFLEQNKVFMSTTNASEAITKLNEATIQLLSACKSCSGGNGGSQNQMSAMQRMLQGQQQIMKESQALLQMRAAQEQLLQQRQAAMQRLAGQQRSMQEIAENIQKQLKKDERILGRMDKAAREMEEVIRDLEGGVLNEQTLRKEQRIFSRLLDAQRSVNNRDYEKKRLSASAGDVYSAPGGVSRAKSTSLELRDEIRRAMALKAPGEFEDLIRMYFRALAEEAPLTTNEK